VSFTAIMAVRTAAKKEARHNHTLRPRSRPTYTVSAHGDLNLTSKLAKLGLQIGGPGRVGGAVGPQNRRPHHGQQRQRRHGAGWAGGEGGEGREGRRRGGGACSIVYCSPSRSCSGGGGGGGGVRNGRATDRK
jgi:hypothetical protein